MTSPHSLRLALSLNKPDFSLELDLELPGKGITVLFGPSGSGKTTVLRCVAGSGILAMCFKRPVCLNI